MRDGARISSCDADSVWTSSSCRVMGGERVIEKEEKEAIDGGAGMKASNRGEISEYEVMEERKRGTGMKTARYK